MRVTNSIHLGCYPPFCFTVTTLNSVQNDRLRELFEFRFMQTDPNWHGARFPTEKLHTVMPLSFKHLLRLKRGHACD
jgi:hypothetical protein